MRKQFSLDALKYWPKIFKSVLTLIYFILMVVVCYVSFERNFPVETSNQQKSLLVSLLFILVLAFALSRIAKYSLIEGDNFVQHNPITLRKLSIPLSEISEVKTNFVNTMYGMHKGLFIELKGGKEIKITSQLNTKKELEDFTKV